MIDTVKWLHFVFEFVAHWTMTNKGILVLSLSSIIVGHRCPSSALAPPLYLFLHTHRSAPPGAAAVSGALTSLRDPCGDFVAARPLGVGAEAPDMSRKLFLFPRVSIKVCIGWGWGGVRGWILLHASPPSPPSLCVCECVCVCTGSCCIAVLYQCLPPDLIDCSG